MWKKGEIMFRKLTHLIIATTICMTVLSAVETPCYAGVTYTTSAITPSWPGPDTPLVATYSDPNVLWGNATGGTGNRVFEKFESGRVVSQTFLVPADQGFTLSKMVITGGGSTTPALVFTIHLFDITGEPCLPGSYAPATAGPDPNTDLFENCYFISPVNGDKFITFTFTGRDKTPLESSHTYAFEIWGPSAATAFGPFFWFRGISSVSTYTGGDGYSYPNSPNDVNTPPSDTRNRRSQLSGGGRDATLAVYGTPYNGRAYGPDPWDGNTGIELTPLLSWTAGQWADAGDGHNVYLGTNFDEVDDATTSTTGIFLGNVTEPNYQIVSSLTGVDYYWRVDEINDTNADSPWKGEVWHFTTINTTPVIPPPWLHVDGNQIKDPNGTVVVLRGLSFIDLGATNADTGALNLIDRITNTNDPNGDSPGWYPRILRIPICPHDSALYGSSPLTFEHGFDPNDPTDSNTIINGMLYNLLRDVVDYCARKNLYVIIDWHHMANTYDEANDTNVFWTYMAPKFAGDSHVLFELFNEPTNFSGLSTDAEKWDSVRQDMQTWVDIVRTYAPYNLILVGTPSYDQILAPVVGNPIVDDNVVYVSHLYPYHWLGLGADPQWYRDQITDCAAEYPVICTEWGFTNDPDYYGNDPCQYFDGNVTDFGEPFKDFIEEYGISFTAWVVSNTWSPPMFDENWQLRLGDGNMGCFTKDWLFEQNAEEAEDLTITKCTIKAGKIQGIDSFDIAGTFATTPSLSDLVRVRVDLSSDGTTIYSQNIPYIASQISKGKYKYSYKIPKGQAGAITSLKIDPVKRTFAIKAKNVDLTGLGCPVQLDIAYGVYLASGEASETIVNGSKKLIPTRLMRTYQDTLIVTKAKAASETLSVKGEIAVEDISNTDMEEPNLVKVDVNVVWGNQTFTLPAGSFVAAKTGHSYSCKAVPSTDDANDGLVTAKIDLDKCTFTVSVKEASGLDVGPADVTFGINFGDDDFTEEVPVNVGTGRSY